MRLLAPIVAVLLTEIVTSAVIPSKYATFEDDFGRFKMMPMSAAAYADDPNLCVQASFTNASIYNVVEVICDAIKVDSCRGFTAVSHYEKTIIVSFRGTNAFTQLLDEGMETIAASEEFIAGGRVSSYFYEAFKRVWNGGMKDDFLTLRNKYPDYEVNFSKHSVAINKYFLGVGHGALAWGAMASLCAATMVHEGMANAQKLVMVTFGQPRVGDQTFADAHNALVPFGYRVVHNRDSVPHVPPKHFPAAFFDGYVHHASEVFYENDMSFGSTYRVCNADNQSQCSDSLWVTVSVTDHLHYYQKQEMFPDFGEDGCPVKFLTT